MAALEGRSGNENEDDNNNNNNQNEDDEENNQNEDDDENEKQQQQQSPASASPYASNEPSTNSTGQHNNDKPDKPEPNKHRKHHRNTHVPSPSSSTAAIFKHTTHLSEQLNDHSTDSLSTTVQARLNTAQRFELLEKQSIVTEAPTSTARAN
jgi:hypothetical protein